MKVTRVFETLFRLQNKLLSELPFVDKTMIADLYSVLVYILEAVVYQS